ncbi:MAG: hypothetical protein H7Y41_03490 [Hyphomonadaceae bacterium]|nr:hypothetical protein [Clostridia bacterium]
MKLILQWFNVVRSKTCLYRVGLIALFILFFVVLENRYPYFFLQDDIRDLGLPNYAFAFKSLLNGEFAMYNFHQFMGYPIMATGLSGAQYPLTYIASILSQLSFGNLYAVIDEMMFIHVIISGLGVFSLLRLMKLDKGFAFLGALTFPITSYMIYVSNSWLVVAFAGAYTPWMLYFSLKSYRNASTANFMGGLLIRLLLVYAGYMQYFVCAVIFEFVFIATVAVSDYLKHKDKKKIGHSVLFYVSNYICVLFLSLPFLLPAWDHMQHSSDRQAALSFSIYSAMSYALNDLMTSLFYPFTKPNMAIPTFAIRYMPYLSFLGYIPILTILCAPIIYFFTREKKKSKSSNKKQALTQKEMRKLKIAKHDSSKEKDVDYGIYIKAFIILVVISFFWIVKDSLFISFVYMLPILNRFRWPMKLTIYFNLFVVILSAILLFTTINRFKHIRINKNLIAIILALINFTTLTTFYVSNAHYTFAYHNDPQPFKGEVNAEMLKSGRLANVGFHDWTYGTMLTLGHNYATLFGLQSIAGYNPIQLESNARAGYGKNNESFFAADKNLPIQSFREDGVCWYIVAKEKEKVFVDLFKGYNMEQKASDKHRVIFYDKGAMPLVYSSKTDVNIASHTTANTIVTNVKSDKDCDITLNYLYNTYFVAYIDGKITNIEITNKNKMHFNMPAGTHTLVVKYKNPYFENGLLIAGSFIALMLMVLVARTFQKRKIAEQSENLVSEK